MYVCILHTYYKENYKTRHIQNTNNIILGNKIYRFHNPMLPQSQARVVKVVEIKSEAKFHRLF